MKVKGLIIFLFVSSLTNAQEQFLAYQVEGAVSYYVQNKKTSLIKTGKVLPVNSIVKVEKNARLTLICSSTSASMELKEGTHNLARLVGSCKVSTGSVTSNYFKYVWWQMTNPKASPTAEQQANPGAGAVVRGCQGISTTLPDTIGLFERPILLTWKTTKAFERMEVAIYQGAGSPVPLGKLLVDSSSINSDSLRSWMQEAGEYYWTILLDGKEVCDRKLIQVWDAENIKEVMDNARSVAISLPGEAEKNYFLGYMLEQDRLLADALHYYQLALKSEPANDRYKRTIIRFNNMIPVDQKK